MCVHMQECVPVCICVCACVYVPVLVSILPHVVRGQLSAVRSLLLGYTLSSGAQIQVISLGSKGSHPLGHFPAPQCPPLFFISLIHLIDSVTLL